MSLKGRVEKLEGKLLPKRQRVGRPCKRADEPVEPLDVNSLPIEAAMQLYEHLLGRPGWGESHEPIVYVNVNDLPPEHRQAITEHYLRQHRR